MNENEISSETMELTSPKINQKEKNRKGKIKFLICGFLVVISIAIGLFIGYKKLNNDPMSIYRDSINGIYKKLNNALKESKNKNFTTLDLTKDPFIVDLKAKLDSNMPELKPFTGLDYHLNVGMDLANKKMNMGLDINENNNSLLNLVLSVIDKNIYLKLYDKILDLGEEDIFGNMNIETYFKVNGNNAKFDYDNYIYILKEIKTIIIDSLDKNKFKMEETKITLNTKEYKVKKAIYNLDKENIERTIKFINSKILKNEKLLKTIAESIGLKEEELKEKLNEEVNTNNINDIKINLYADKLNNTIAGSVETENEEIIKFDCIDKETNFVIAKDNQKLTVTVEKNNNIVITFAEEYRELFKITIEENNKNYKIPFTFNVEGNTINGILELNNISETKESSSIDFVFSLNTTIASEKIDFKIDGNYKISKTDISTIDPTGSIKIENISEEEAMEIFEKLNSLFTKFGLNDLAGSII
ncbi:MAG: hypothetical protein HFI49_04890 [Bacilli bacterium]|jgi:hypothetical protein|nr:hypothetical protein [Bacilli bacterium]